ncbi:hypothetical protein BHQ23_27580 [Mycobacterium gordonae]|uniref:Uncharacterized protein n=1 Tax=Mycobacterium gordonae TaxID=1778 RepID=A0A1X1XC16_MYCGO|nr:hypothetical protein BHQ23_27580 [Mycobacterium gordonae]ORV96427.1 hypothetical protein AWC08_00215 [Mycobacterium gordonae]
MVVRFVAIFTKEMNWRGSYGVRDKLDAMPKDAASGTRAENHFTVTGQVRAVGADLPVAINPPQYASFKIDVTC